VKQGSSDHHSPASPSPLGHPPDPLSSQRASMNDKQALQAVLGMPNMANVEALAALQAAPAVSMSGAPTGLEGLVGLSGLAGGLSGLAGGLSGMAGGLNGGLAGSLAGSLGSAALAELNAHALLAGLPGNLVQSMSMSMPPIAPLQVWFEAGLGLCTEVVCVCSCACSLRSI